MLRISFLAITTLLLASVTTAVVSANDVKTVGTTKAEVEYINHVKNVTSLNVFVETDAGVLHCAE